MSPQTTLSDFVQEAPPASEAEPGSKHKTEQDEAPVSVSKRTRGAANKDVKTNGDAEENGKDHEGEDKAPTTSHAKEENQEKTPKQEEGAAVVEGGRDTPPPSNMLEKGIIYFFFRARVGDVEDGEEPPHKVDDIARTFIVLRPVETDASLGDGTIGDAGNARLLALPKKTLPRSGRDRFMAFVEKGGTSFATLRETFLDSSDHETKTRGVRHTPAATPIAEGVYAITTTGRESHLAYMLTIPSELGEVQTKLGLKEKGSFIISTKNPEYDDGPPNARFKEKPNYPKKMMEEFRSLRWPPSKPEHLDYENAQVLLIGESSGVQKALEPQPEEKGGSGGAKKEGEEEPLEEMEKLEDEDTARMEHLAGDESSAIFADLQARAQGYPKLQTTF